MRVTITLYCGNLSEVEEKCERKQKGKIQKGVLCLQENIPTHEALGSIATIYRAEVKLNEQFQILLM